MPRASADRFAELVDSEPLALGEPAATESADDDRASAGTEIGLLSLVGALRTMDLTVEPSQDVKSRQRQRLVSMAAVRTTGVATTDASDPADARQSPVAAARSWLRARFAGRLAISSLATLSVLVAALGVLTILAQSALPGDALYSLKRGTEQARLALAGSEVDEGRELLGFASTRLDELDQLLDQPGALRVTGSGILAASSEADADLLIATMDTMDQQTIEGTNALATSAIDEINVSSLQFVGEWGVDQFEALSGLTQRMPEQAQARAEASKAVLQRVVQRLEELAQVIDCDCLNDQANTDELGPLPCPTCAESSQPGSTTAPAPSAQPGGGTGGGVTPDPVPAPNTSAAPVPTQEPAPPAVPPVDPPVDPPVVPPVVPTVVPEPPSNEGQSCTLVGILGVQIPGIIINGVCVGLGG